LTSQSAPSSADRFAYTGAESQSDLGYQLHDHRWYDTRTGRWTSEDPDGFGAGDYHLERYLHNGPTNATDPSGLEGVPAAGLPGVPGLAEQLKGDPKGPLSPALADKLRGNPGAPLTLDEQKQLADGYASAAAAGLRPEQAMQLGQWHHLRRKKTQEGIAEELLRRSKMASDLYAQGSIDLGAYARSLLDELQMRTALQPELAKELDDLAAQVEQLLLHLKMGIGPRLELREFLGYYGLNDLPQPEQWKHLQPEQLEGLQAAADGGPTSRLLPLKIDVLLRFRNIEEALGFPNPGWTAPVLLQPLVEEFQKAREAEARARAAEARADWPSVGPAPWREEGPEPPSGEGGSVQWWHFWFGAQEQGQGVFWDMLCAVGGAACPAPRPGLRPRVPASVPRLPRGAPVGSVRSEESRGDRDLHLLRLAERNHMPQGSHRRRKKPSP
jgi:RHS repeat-associated protein